jgi:hypothetical protein
MSNTICFPNIVFQEKGFWGKVFLRGRDSSEMFFKNQGDEQYCTAYSPPYDWL